MPYPYMLDPDGPVQVGDLGKQWVAWCRECKWRRRFGWKGQHKVAIAAALEHHATHVGSALAEQHDAGLLVCQNCEYSIPADEPSYSMQVPWSPDGPGYVIVSCVDCWPGLQQAMALLQGGP